MPPFGIQIVIYLFLAGVAAGAAFFGSIVLASRAVAPFRGGRRSLVLAMLCAVTGSIFLIFDLTRPSDFVLILTSANTGSAISWGARILVLFILSASFVWAVVRNWGRGEIEGGFKQFDLVGLWLLRLAALGLAIYPAFVLRQCEAFPLWQNPLIIPLIAISSLHCGLAALLLATRSEERDAGFRLVEPVLGIAQLVLLGAVYGSATSPPMYFIALLCTLVSIRFPSKMFNLRIIRHVLVIVSAFAIRCWLIAAGQSI